MATTAVSKTANPGSIPGASATVTRLVTKEERVDEALASLYAAITDVDEGAVRERLRREREGR